MKKVQDVKAYYYFDEALTPEIFGRGGINLIEKGVSSKTFIVGYLETKTPKEISSALVKLQKEITEDEYYKNIPSIKNSIKMFHANKDVRKIREKVFRLLKNFDWSFYCIVARKKEDYFRKNFDLNKKKLYEYLVSKLLENRLHLYSQIDCYFSAMGNTVRKENMQNAINEAIKKFQEKWGRQNNSNIRVFIQQSSSVPMLQASDYILWTVQRAYEMGEFRFYEFLKDKIKLVHDIFDFEKYLNNYYSSKNPLEAKKIDPI